MDQLIHILKGLFSLDLPSCPVSSEHSHRPKRGRWERKYTCSKVQFQTTEIPPNRSRCGPEGRGHSLLACPRELQLEFKTPDMAQKETCANQKRKGMVGGEKKLLRYRETISLVVRTRGKSLSFAKSGPYRSCQNVPSVEYQSVLVIRFLGKA